MARRTSRAANAQRKRPLGKVRERVRHSANDTWLHARSNEGLAYFGVLEYCTQESTLSAGDMETTTADMATATAPTLRVLSLLSASTEIVHRLGCAQMLVGRSHGCDDPPLATTLAVVTAPRVDPNASSREIDESVRVQAAAGGPIYQVHSDTVTDLRPDVIITQEQCRICAVTPEDVTAVCSKLPTAKLETNKPTTLDDVLGDVITIARALQVPERGERLVAMMRARLAYWHLQ